MEGSGVAGSSQRDTEVRLPRTTRVKDKRPAERQITTEQILRTAKELQLEDDVRPPRQIITAPGELRTYKLRKRREFEDLIRRVGRFNVSCWFKYAQWEEAQRDFRRARSVWERCLDVTYTNVSVWLRYAEMEMRNRFINHARNVWDRAVSLLPRVDQLWYKYIHMEEMLGNVAGARKIFERWMTFEPDHEGWSAFIRYELRYEEVNKAREVFEKYVQILPEIHSWIRYAKFEMKNGELGLSRRCYERAVEALGEDGESEELFLKFAEFEEMVKEYDRARVIYKSGPPGRIFHIRFRRFALDRLPKSKIDAVYQRFIAFEKKNGKRDDIESAVLSKRRITYEDQVKSNPLNYDAWFDYMRLEMAAGVVNGVSFSTLAGRYARLGDVEKIRDVFERAVSHVPPGNEKRFWQRYIYLWINYSLYEELETKDVERTRAVNRACLNEIPHQSFTFAKIWIMAAQFEVRQGELDAARKLLGTAIGMAPKEKTFRTYIEMELMLGNIDRFLLIGISKESTHAETVVSEFRCRTLYAKLLEWNPSNCNAWCRFTELERSLQEDDRARAIFELAITQPMLDMPELLWKAYIDFEIENGNRNRTRVLYERLLDRTNHMKVWMSFAQFEATSLPDAEEDDAEAESDAERLKRARSVFRRGFSSIRETQPDAKDDAVLLLQAWRKFEQETELVNGEEEREQSVAEVAKRFPKRVKMKRSLYTDDGGEAGMEEYYDYIFADEAGAAPNIKLLEMAQKWKKRRVNE